MYILFLMSFAWVLIFLISLIFSLLVKTTFFKKLAIFTLLFVCLRIFLFDFLISSFGVDLHPKTDPYPIIYSNSGAKLHIDNVCKSRKYGEGEFGIDNIDLSGSKVVCRASSHDSLYFRGVDNNAASEIWLQGDIAKFGYTFIKSNDKYQFFNWSISGLTPDSIITYVAKDGYRVLIRKSIDGKTGYDVNRRINNFFEVDYHMDKDFVSFRDLEKRDDIIITYARSISRSEK